MILEILKKLKNAILFRNKNPYYNNPFGQKPLASRDEYLSIWKDAKNKSYPVIDEYEINMKHKIDSNWFHELALHTQVVIKESEICYQHGRILFSTLCDYIENNNVNNVNILDIGTARGFSAVVMASAVVLAIATTENAMEPSVTVKVLVAARVWAVVPATVNV